MHAYVIFFSEIFSLGRNSTMTIHFLFSFYQIYHGDENPLNLPLNAKLTVH